MPQVHKRFTDDQLRNLFRAYDDGQIDRAQMEDVLGIGKTRFFALWKLFRKDPGRFSIAYHRGSPRRLAKGRSGDFMRERRPNIFWAISGRPRR